MESFKKAQLFFGFMIVAALLAAATSAWAQTPPPSDDIIRGAQLYDKWYAVLGVDPPAGDMPIWSRQTTNTRSGPDTWRCSECHGWDYRGAEGAYASGSHRTGFPNVMALASTMQVDEIVGHLKGDKDPAHNFSAYLDDTSLGQLASFLKSGVIDDTQYIDPVSLQVKDGNIDHGKQLYGSTCTTCHGEDGKKILFRTEGIDEYLGSVANRDPWRFLHRTRFGVAGTNMPIGAKMGWTPADGRDILAFVQTLPTGGQIPTTQPPGAVTTLAAQPSGGPATDLFTGILTGLGTFFGMGFYSILFITGFILLGFIVVTILRARR